MADKSLNKSANLDETTWGRELAPLAGFYPSLYVGAPWCEPCVRFHDAAAAGKLDRDFPDLRLLELDRDRDQAELGKAGCLSQMIPLFARPTPEGRCSERSIEGSIKGDGAVAELTPRLQALLRRPSVSDGPK